MKFWTTLILLIFPLLAACAPSNVTPTATIVRLDRSALTPTAPAETVADTPPTATPIPFPSPTPAATPVSLTTPTPSISPTLSAGMPAITATATAAAQVEIITAGLNVREGPGVAYPAIGTVVQDEVFDLTGVSADGGWLQISQAGRPGWISSQPTYVRVTGSLSDIPTVDSAAGPPSPVPGQAPAVGGQPAAVNPGGQLLFTTRSGGHLYIVNFDGSGLRKLAGGVIDPVVSPDGRQVAFTRWDSSKLGALYLLNLADGGERVVAGDIRRPKSPAWSPDGQAIVVSFQHGGTVDPQPECRTFDADDGFQLPNVSEITSVRQKSDGSVEICFIRIEDLQWGLRRINLASGQAEDLPADLYSFNPTWDPQNPWRLIYDGQRGLMQLDVDSGKLQPFTTDVRDAAPVFSPDGQKLALTYKQHDHWEVYTYDLATGSRRRLTEPPLLANPQYNSAAPAWSPDGSQIVFVTDRSGQWEIWGMNADGSNQRPLLPAEVQAGLGLEYHGVNERLLNWLGASGPAPAAPVAMPIEASLSGEWDFAFGSMSLSEQNESVKGSYQWYGGADTGQLKGVVLPNLGQFQGLWLSDRSPNSQGFWRGQLSAAGTSFSGTFEGSETSQPWCGVRSGQPLPTGCGFSGVWQLRFGDPPGLGQATLTQTGATVEGTFVDSQGQSGEIVGGVVTVQSLTEATLSGVWRNAQGKQDSFEWRLNLTTGRTFEGRRDPGNSEWCGWRQGTTEPDECGF
ncbi:MAG: SH3 domain-containing protein [Anaerolineae bacterium]|nr:SH3 domain-containing protein [Anaerolineae bacterium]